MGSHQDALTKLMFDAGRTPASLPPVARMDALSPSLRSEMAALYERLGGQAPLPVKTGSWDMAFGELVIELDEEQHFNRYRRLTLDTPFAADLPWRNAYVEQCDSYEEVCLKKASNRGYWTSPATERMFGPPGPRRELNGAGSPRWKQRALYDALRDACALNGSVRLVRLSRWDDIGGVPLWQVLGGTATIDHDLLHSLIADRTIG